jgi:hypothetical protein
MKPLPAILLAFLLATLDLTGQQLFNNQHKGLVLCLDPRMMQHDIVPGEILVKFRDPVKVSIHKSGGIVKTGITRIDQILLKSSVTAMQKIFPGAMPLKSKQIQTGINGCTFERPSLHNMYKLKLKSGGDISQTIEALKADSLLIEFAEPNYILSITDDKPVGDIIEGTGLRAQDSMATSSVDRQVSLPPFTPNDPLYSQQGYLQAIHADDVWQQTTGNNKQIIAILDTGVDWTHPDLVNKIWQNPGEIAGNGIDDDGNGKIDDIRGWDWINNDNNPMDDNSHGTHVAGIAAAEANNGTGIAGVCPEARIMALKVFQSNGTADIATIIQGIYYASNNGATIINMSFGTYARSFALENALQDAYFTSTLVAAAGNDGKSIYPRNPLDFPTFYPAALPYVLGVQYDNGNFDPDGPLFSTFPERFNYELIAPGSAIISTTPNGSYRYLTGSSMATPQVSGAIALYQSFYPEKSREDLWGDLIHNAGPLLNISAALFNNVKNPVFDLLEFSYSDTLPGCNKDGQADAGEVIELAVMIRNSFSPADSAYVLLKPAIDGDPKDITILQDSVFLGPVGTFANISNSGNPFSIRINNTAYNERSVTFNLEMKNKGNAEVFIQPLKIEIFNGSELSGLLDHDTTLTPNRLWLINNSLRIGSGVTLNVLPGTKILVNAGVDNRGTINLIGKPDSLIYIKGSLNCSVNKYVYFDLNGSAYSSTGIIENCTFVNGKTFSANRIDYCYLRDFSAGDGINIGTIYRSYLLNIISPQIRGDFQFSILDNAIIGQGIHFWSSQYSVFNKISSLIKHMYPAWPQWWLNEVPMVLGATAGSPLYRNSFLTNDPPYSMFVKAYGSEDAVVLPNQYWGTIDPVKIRKKYFDFSNDASLPVLQFAPISIAPSDSCPGHVWKVLLDGRDAQDQFGEPAGVGKHRFDIYFNRAMDKSRNPKVSFGVRQPYNQQDVDEDGEWSADGKIFTVYKTFKITTGDGINRIRVSDARESDGWDFAIPVEDQRFSFVLSAASSASLDFQATPGLGKVAMEWNNASLDDLLGFNMYRMEHATDTTLTTPLLVNSTLITDTVFTDFTVTPNRKYYYFYKVVRTNFSESDSSRVVTATPFTASKGDANGDLSVNVLDITTIVAYLLNQNPQPFIFEAGDMNSDGAINILDIIGVVREISGTKSGFSDADCQVTEKALLRIEDGKVFLDSKEKVTALQFELEADSVKDFQLIAKAAGFEFAWNRAGNKVYGVIFSLSGALIEGSNKPLFEVSGNSNWTWKEGFGATADGCYIPLKLATGIFQPATENGMKVYPNPFSHQVSIRYELAADALVIIGVYDIQGRLVKKLVQLPQVAGSYQADWQGGNSNGKLAPAGVYFIRMEIKNGPDQSVTLTDKIMKVE